MIVPFGLRYARRTERVVEDEILPLLVRSDKLGIERVFVETE